MDAGDQLRKLLSFDGGCPECSAALEGLSVAQERLVRHAIEEHADRVLYSVAMLPEEVADAINALGRAVEDAP